jgi:hypothetical protein
MTDTTTPPMPQIEGTPEGFLLRLAHDLLHAERLIRSGNTPPPWNDRLTLASIYGQASRHFRIEPVGTYDHEAIVADAVRRTGACPMCLSISTHTTSCPVPF